MIKKILSVVAVMVVACFFGYTLSLLATGHIQIQINDPMDEDDDTMIYVP